GCYPVDNINGQRLVRRPGIRHANRRIDLLHVTVPEPGGEIPGVVATEGSRPTLVRTRIAFGENARAGLQVGARLECLLVGVEAVLAEVLPVDLRQAKGKVVSALLEHPDGRQRFGQGSWLAYQSSADNTDRVRIE